MKLKKKWINLIIILVVIGLAVFLITRQKPQTSEEVARCIGQNSMLYVQLGCHACKTQEDMFGENYQFLNKIDCWYEQEKCSDITSTPTWLIKGKKYEGVQSIEKLKELTGCK